MTDSTTSCCQTDSTEFKQIAGLSSLLKLIGEQNRLQILCLLSQGEHCVCELEKHVEQSQSLISHHLKDLKTAGIIVPEKRGLNVYYQLTPKGKQITHLIFQLMNKEAIT